MKFAERSQIQVALGWGLAGLGVIGALSFWTYTSTPPRTDTFWRWPGYVSLGSLVIGAAIVAIPRHLTALAKRVRQRTARTYLGLFASVVLVILAALLVTAVAWTLIGFAVYGEWTTALPRTETTRADATRLVLTITAGIGAAVALVVAYRRQSSLEEGRFLERLATAARQIGDREPIVQFSGVYAIVALADEPMAPGARQTERRQQCVSVLCAYLRLPYSPGAHESFVQEIVHKQTWNNSQGQVEETRRYSVRPADREVRQTIIRIIGEHLRLSASTSWSDMSLDFHGAVFDGGDFSAAVFNGPLTDFRDAHFAGGTVDFNDARFTGGEVSFNGARFTAGSVVFGSAQFAAGTVYFRDAWFSGADVYFNYGRFSGGAVDFSDAHFTGGAVDFTSAEFTAGTVYFNGARFTGGNVGFSGSKFTGSTVYFTFADFTGGIVDFNSSEFGDGIVNFSRAEFAGAAVYFFDTSFTGGTVNFRGMRVTGGTVDFDEAHFTGSIVNFHSAEFEGGAVAFGDAQFTGGAVGFTNAQFSGGIVDFREVTGANPGILDFNDPVDWAVPPLVPWNAGDSPSWVHPATWPPDGLHVPETDLSNPPVDRAAFVELE